MKRPRGRPRKDQQAPHPWQQAPKRKADSAGDEQPKRLVKQKTKQPSRLQRAALMPMDSDDDSEPLQVW